MGADYIGQVTTVVEERYSTCTAERLEEYLKPDATVRRLLDASQPLREEVENLAFYEDSGTDIESARAVLLSGWEAMNGARTHNYFPMGRGLALLTAGGMSWGDSPYDDFDAESVLVDTALCDAELGALTGIVAGVPEVDFIESWIEHGAESA